MRRLAIVVVLLSLCVVPLAGTFAADAPKPGASASAPAAVAQPQAQPRTVTPTPGQWVGFDQGQYTIVATQNGGSSLVAVFSTWDPILGAGTFTWSKDRDADRNTKAYRLSAALGTIPGVVEVVITRHRVDVQRAFVYSWDSILPQLLEAFRKSDLVKQGG
jgi:hypothetical protein